jgi:hypothetical protein
MPSIISRLLLLNAVFVAIGLLVAAAGVLAAPPEPVANPQLLVPGRFDGDEIPVDAEGSWMALVERDGDFFLEAVHVGVTASTVVTALPVTALLRGVAGLAPGAVTTYLSATPLHDALKVRAGDASIGMNCGPDPNPGTQGYLAKCPLTVEQGGRSRVLYDYPAWINDDGSLRYQWDSLEPLLLLWAGDLDGDGGLDVLMETRPNYNVTVGLRLWLSASETPIDFYSLGC